MLPFQMARAGMVVVGVVARGYRVPVIRYQLSVIRRSAFRFTDSATVREGLDITLSEYA